jgi:hypothetical protein
MPAYFWNCCLPVDVSPPPLTQLENICSVYPFYGNGPLAPTVSAKKARGSEKIGGFLYLRQILQISHYTAETLQNYALISEVLRKKFHLLVLGLANHTFLFKVR